MDEVAVPCEEWRFRRFVEEQFGGEARIILAAREGNYAVLKRLLAPYCNLRFSATEVLVAYSTNAVASTALRRRALRASVAPRMVVRCDEFLRRKGAVICPECSDVMSPAGSVYVCEGCGGLGPMINGGGDAPDRNDPGPTAPPRDDGNGMMVSA